MTSETDPSGNAHNIEYSFAGRFKSMHFADGSTQELTPSIQKGLVDISLGLGDSKENPAPNTFADEINSTIVDGNGNVTTIKTDNFGKITESSDNCCFGRITKIERNKDGLATSISKANGAVTTMTYDENGNLLTSTDQSINATTTFTYDPNFNKVTSITDPNGNTTTINYDTKGNPIEIIDAQSNTTTQTYNSQGQLQSIEDASGNTTTFAYNINGNLTTIIDSLLNITTLTIDPAGNLIKKIDGNNNSTIFVYDLLNRLIKVTNANNIDTIFNYDANGNMLQVADANNVTLFKYDLMDRLISNTDPLGNTDTFEYDRNGNLITSTDRNGQIINFQYDSINQLIKKMLPGQLNTVFNYDLTGNLIMIAEPESKLTFIYDRSNRLTNVSTLGSVSQPNVEIIYAYDLNGNRLSMTDSITGTTNYVYDELNRLKSVENPSGQKISFDYDVLNRHIFTSFPNDITTRLTYDSNSRLKSLQHKSGLTIVAEYGYTYDNIGNRELVNTIRTGVEVNNNLSYVYDSLYQVIQATRPLFSQPNETFKYDQLGNRLKRDGQTINSAIGPANRLLDDTIFTYIYDDKGNLTQKVDKSTNAITIYTYDNENQLVRIDLPNDSIAKYLYDGFGRRIIKNIDGAVTKYVYDNEDILFEFNEMNGKVSRYTHGSGLDEPLVMERGDKTLFYQADGLGSITDLTDSNGAIFQSYVYDSFGNIVRQIGTLQNPFTYAGREVDDETGLYYCRARYYDASIGKFLIEDPIRFASGDINFYRYTGNNPVNLTDPWGLTAWTCRRPLGGRPGEELSIIPKYYHQYNCITMSDGSIKCESSNAGPNWPSAPWNLEPGIPSEDIGAADFYHPNACEEIDDQDDDCVERCLELRWGQERPNYDIGPFGTDCQEYSVETFDDCVLQCYSK